MNHKEATLLLEKYNNGTASAEEIKLLENWYSAESLSQQFSDQDVDLSRLKDEIWAGTLQRANLTHLLIPSSSKIVRRRLWGYRISVAAALLLCLGVLFIQRSNNRFSAEEEIADQIHAGKNTATLTLANGRKIVLSEAVKGKLAEEAGISITKTAEGELIYKVISAKNAADESKEAGMQTIVPKMNLISTARGEHYQVVLPDGSRIWLNAATSLKFPASFTGSPDRSVELDGEAYFEVAKDKSHPFKVRTNGQVVEVLGTHFNISSYADRKSTRTTLLEGSVRVSPLGYANGKEGEALSSGVLLKPGEQAVQEAGSIEVMPADIEQVTAWKEGWFCFKSTSLKNVLYEASKWYDLEIVYAHDIPTDHFTGKIPRNASLGKFMKLLKLSDIKFRIQGRKMIIDKD